ncbi:MAG: restriction endonuclease subunit S [Chloroflexi bacterium]|nr:restriction endonuclease subunit S [Chloroflexota bacterium]
MSEGWPKVALRDVLRPVSRPEPVDPSKTYRILGAHWYAVGLYTKDIKAGSQIRADTIYRVNSGDFVYNRLFAWKGSFAIASEENDGCYVSNEFPCFQVDSGHVYAQFLHYCFSRPSVWEDALRLSSGGTPTSRNRLKENNFLSVRVALPPPPEQRRIVARIEELAAKIEEARTLRQVASQQMARLLPRMTSHLLDGQQWELQRLETLLAEPPRNGLSPQREVLEYGRPMLRISSVSSSPNRFVDLTACKKVDASDALADPFVVQEGDVFVVRYNGDINRLGKAAILRTTLDHTAVYPDKLIRLRANHAKMDPDFLVYALSSRPVRLQVEQLGKTTAGQIGISGTDVKSFVIPVPPLLEQRRIVAQLDDLQCKIDSLKHLQTQTATELDALVLSILDRAFKGEL